MSFLLSPPPPSFLTLFLSLLPFHAPSSSFQNASLTFSFLPHHPSPSLLFPPLILHSTLLSSIPLFLSTSLHKIPFLYYFLVPHMLIFNYSPLLYNCSPSPLSYCPSLFNCSPSFPIDSLHIDHSLYFSIAPPAFQLTP